MKLVLENNNNKKMVHELQKLFTNSQQILNDDLFQTFFLIIFIYSHRMGLHHLRNKSLKIEEEVLRLIRTARILQL